MLDKFSLRFCELLDILVGVAKSSYFHNPIIHQLAARLNADLLSTAFCYDGDMFNGPLLAVVLILRSRSRCKAVRKGEKYRNQGEHW